MSQILGDLTSFAPEEAFSRVSLAVSLGWNCILTVVHLANDGHTIDEPWLLPCLGIYHSLQGFLAPAFAAPQSPIFFLRYSGA